MDENQPSYLEQTLSLPCKNCGSQLYYSAKIHKLHCEHCGNTEEINPANDQVVEHSLAHAMQQAREYSPEDIGKKVFGCENCGAHFMVESSKDVKVECGFCGSQNVNLEAHKHQFIQPMGIIPFFISRAEGMSQFKEWIKKGWFHPGKLKKLASVEKLHGIYLPFWTYDAQTESDWRGEAGYYYYETKRVRRNGQWETVRVQKVRWVRRSGHLSHFFDDVLVLGSGVINQEDIERIFPFHLKELVNYDPRLLVGWEAEVYDIEVDAGYHIADRQMDQKIHRMCSSQLGGDTQRGLRVSTQKSRQTFKHIILPIWISSYRYKNKVFRFLINGQTGKVYGKKPLSVGKIALAVIAGLLIAAGIYIAADWKNVQVYLQEFQRGNY